jgi:hypothetical protein
MHSAFLAVHDVPFRQPCSLAALLNGWQWMAALSASITRQACTTVYSSFYFALVPLKPSANIARGHGAFPCTPWPHVSFCGALSVLSLCR